VAVCRRGAEVIKGEIRRMSWRVRASPGHPRGTVMPALRFEQRCFGNSFDALAGSNQSADFRVSCCRDIRERTLYFAGAFNNFARDRRATEFHPGFIDSTLTDNSLVKVAPFNLTTYMASPRATNMLSRRNRVAVLFAQICLRRMSRHAPFYFPNCKTIKNICVITR